MTHAWIVSEGEYSDYTVHCVFESEEDAERYVYVTNRNEILATHNTYVRDDITPPNAHLKCVDPVETCPAHHDVWAQGEWRLYTERKDYYPKGTRPFIAANPQERGT